MVSRREKRLSTNNPYYIPPASSYSSLMKSRAKTGFRMKKNYVPIPAVKGTPKRKSSFFDHFRSKRL